MTDKIHCGIKPVPKNHKLGTMQQCLEKNQVKYWGIKKVDPRMLEASKTIKKTKKVKSLDDIRIMQVSFRGKIKRKTIDLGKEKDTKKKEEITKEIRELRKQLDLVNAQAIKMEEERKIAQEKKTSRKTSKKTSKKIPKKTPTKTTKKTSRKTNKK